MKCLDSSVLSKKTKFDSNAETPEFGQKMYPNIHMEEWYTLITYPLRVCWVCVPISPDLDHNGLGESLPTLQINFTFWRCSQLKMR